MTENVGNCDKALEDYLNYPDDNMIPLENMLGLKAYLNDNTEHDAPIINTNAKLSLCDFNDIKIEDEVISCAVKQETDDYLDDDLLLEDTIYLNGCIKDAKIEHRESPTIVKTEIHETKTNKEIKIEDESLANDIHIKFDNKFLSCDHCNEYYEDYCAKCRMLIHILNKNTLTYFDNKAVKEIPDNLVEFKETFGQSGVYTLKHISEGVRFGPFTGLKNPEGSWKVKGGRFVVDNDKLELLNWMQFINPAKNILEHNLVVFQHEDNIYYHSIQEIQEGEELLVYFGEKFGFSSINDFEMDFIPEKKTNIEDVFACTFCCLGFNSVMYLSKHKTICPNDTSEDSSNKDIMQCPYCKIYMEQWECLKYHMPHCRDQNDRQRVLTTLEDRMLASSTQNELYQRDIKDNTNGCCEGMPYSCPICCKRFKHKKNLKPHMASAHARSEMHRCFLCEYEISSKSDLNVHFEASHTKEGKYACTKCAYQSRRKNNLKEHFGIHETEKRFKCYQCGYAANNKNKLTKHTYIHYTVKRFTCTECDYKTNFKTDFQRHLDSHEEVKRFKCSLCDYATNVKGRLKLHTDTHETVKRHKCSLCDYVSKHSNNLKRHVCNHLKIRRFKCSQCDYAAFLKQHLKWHSRTHETEKRFKCSKCDYATHFGSSLRRHLATHETAKELRCSSCDYVTNFKSDLANHCCTRETVN